MDVSQDHIVKVVELSAVVSRVWRALTDHNEFGAWFRVSLDGPFVVGGTTTGRMAYPGHEDVEWVSLTEALEPERRFVFSWPPSAVDPDTPYPEGAKVTVEFLLEPIDSGTRLTIRESGFAQFPGRKRLDILRSNTEGWDIQANNISRYLA